MSLHKLLLVLIVLSGRAFACAVSGTDCSAAAGGPSICCTGLTCQTVRGTTVPKCEPALSSTTTSTTLVGATTTTIPVQHSGAVLRFPKDFIAQELHQGPLIDPRNGAPADEYTRYVEASEAAWQVLPFCLNLYQSQPNSDEAENISKFYQNYSMKAGVNYEWFHPTYVADYLYDICKPTGFGDPARYDATIRAELALLPAPTSNNEENGELSQLDGRPLTDVQCQALHNLSAVHDLEAEAAVSCAQHGVTPDNCTSANALHPEIEQALNDWVGTANSEAQRQLFDLVWDPFVSSGWDLPYFIKQKTAMMHDHMAYEAAFHCDTHAPPDVLQIQLHGDSHNLRHLCLDLDPTFSDIFPVYFRHYSSTYVYHRVTCRQLADD